MVEGTIGCLVLRTAMTPPVWRVRCTMARLVYHVWHSLRNYCARYWAPQLGGSRPMSRHSAAFEQLRQRLDECVTDTHTAMQETAQAARTWRNAQPTFQQHLQTLRPYCETSWSTAENASRQAL